MGPGFDTPDAGIRDAGFGVLSTLLETDIPLINSVRTLGLFLR